MCRGYDFYHAWTMQSGHVLPRVLAVTACCWLSADCREGSSKTTNVRYHQRKVGGGICAKLRHGAAQGAVGADAVAGSCWVLLQGAAAQCCCRCCRPRLGVAQGCCRMLLQGAAAGREEGAVAGAVCSLLADNTFLRRYVLSFSGMAGRFFCLGIFSYIRKDAQVHIYVSRCKDDAVLTQAIRAEDKTQLDSSIGVR